MSLRIHRADRTDLLADGLASLLERPLPDPFAQEVVVVPARGVERWLTQRLSHRLGVGSRGGDGVCAGIDFRSPHSLVAEVLGITDDDPWAADALAWPLLTTIDDSLDEPWMETVARHLGHFDTGTEAELRRSRRYAVASRLARLFAAYAVQRPRLLADWTLDDRQGEAESDGRGGDLDPDLGWQPELWRRLVERVGAVPPHDRLVATVERLRDDPDSFDLPQRLNLFGHTRIPESEVGLLEALAGHRDVHLWLPHPSPTLWGRLADEPAGSVERTTDESHLRTGHPLLITLGRDVRELQRLLASTDAEHQHLPTPTGDRDDLLHWLQADLGDDRLGPPDGITRRFFDDDRSISVHACHGPARQVDVLRETLLALLEEDPTLQPRDVLVMCPDIETYAPLITAAFGLGDVVDGGHPAHKLRVRLADRSLTQTNALLGVAAQLLELAGGRTTASEVLDLAQTAPVRQRFGFTDDNLATITAWVRDSGIRWAFDKEHRAAFGLSDFLQNTWQFGLDRVLTGVAVSADAQAWFGATLPLDDVSSNRVELAGRMAEFVDRLRSACDRLVGTAPLAEWIDALVDGTEALTLVARDDAWQTGQLQREFADVIRGAGAFADTPMRLADVRTLLERHLAGRPTRANFRTGSLTVCTMVPMRSVPHRVVCLLGLDDGVFPRFGLADGDDALARRPFTGERDVRSEDRQLLLDAVLAAGERLVITYTGANEHTGQPRPPAVPLGELLDALDRTAQEPVRDKVLVAHPLQPFDPRNLEPGRLGVPGQPFTFDRTALVAARAAGGQRPERVGFLDNPLSVPLNDDVGLAELLRFFSHPVKGFFSALDVALPWEADPVADAMPVDIDNLEAWAVGERMLEDMLNGIHPDRAQQLEWRRGTLPPGQLGWRIASEIRESAMSLAIAALTHRQVPGRSIDVDVDLPQGRRLTGTIPRVYGDRLVSVGYSRLGPKQMLLAWIQLLAMSAADPDRNWTALVIGRRPRGSQPQTMLLGPLDERAPGLLADLVALYDEGRRRPLPLPIKASNAWAAAGRTAGDPRFEAERKWKSGRYDGEDADPAHQRVWGAHAPIDALLPELGGLAERLWHPMLEFEKGSL